MKKVLPWSCDEDYKQRENFQGPVKKHPGAWYEVRVSSPNCKWNTEKLFDPIFLQIMDLTEDMGITQDMEKGVTTQRMIL